MYQVLLAAIVFFSCFSMPISAVEKSPSVFYPLPTQAQGKVYAVENLFLGDEGGVWIHDIHGKVRFFDGQHILPRTGSALTHNYRNLTYFEHSFWMVFDGSLYKTTPNFQPIKVVDLPAGTAIDKIGVSGHVIWMVSQDYFYTYDTVSLRLETYSLTSLTHYDKSKRVVVNDVTFGLSKWVLATNAGVFVSANQHFEHVKRSGNDYVEKLFFSEKRREMLIGTLDGVLVIDLNHQENQPVKLARSHVLSITETENEYWIGTENGLFVHSFMNGTTRKLKGNVHSDYALKGCKIFALVNDLQGGIWLASEKGVFYYSLFGQKFSRVLPKQIGAKSSDSQFHRITQMPGESTYLLTTSDGVVISDLGKEPNNQTIYYGQVNDTVTDGERLWLATDNGLLVHALEFPSVEIVDLPILLRHSKIEQLEIDDDGVLWGTSGNKLWSLDTKSERFVDYGDEWIVDAYLPAVITQLVATKHNGVLIGTEHGTYSVTRHRITFNSASHKYGQNNHMLEDLHGDIWFAGDYGVYKQLRTTHQTKVIPLAEDSISPKCLMKSTQGIWLSSSSGLTLYSFDGVIKKHFSEPHGLINNEFLPGICTSTQDLSEPRLLIGSTQGMVIVSAEQLEVSNLPNSPVIVSQIKVGNTLVSIGREVPFSVEQGQAISMMFGALPNISHSTLEYKVNESGSWQTIEGNQLTFEHLRSGIYTMQLRRFSPDSRYSSPTQLSFRVVDPWYWSLYARIMYLVLIIGSLWFVFCWRSRLIVKANHTLKSQVDLKTQQLRHQSKIVLRNNLQLRKQIQVRHNLLDKVLSDIEPKLEKLASGARNAEDLELEELVQEARRDLGQVQNLRSDNEETSLIHDLSLVLESAVNSWKDEFLILGMKIELDIQCQKSYIELKQFSLDVIFNTLLSEAAKRLYINQTLYVCCYTSDNNVVVSMNDSGSSAHSIDQAMATTSGFALNQLNDLVSQSGGEMSIFASKEQNVVQLLWPSANITQFATALDKQEEAVTSDESEYIWLNKVEKLVTQHYADAEFSTASVVKTLFMSERSFQRRFKSATGKTFKEYLNEVRLEKACQRLLSGEKVSQVAFECGFNDPSYFSQRFKHHFGLSPTQFIDVNNQ